MAITDIGESIQIRIRFGIGERIKKLYPNENAWYEKIESLVKEVEEFRKYKKSGLYVPERKT